MTAYPKGYGWAEMYWRVSTTLHRTEYNNIAGVGVVVVDTVTKCPPTRHENRMISEGAEFRFHVVAKTVIPDLWDALFIFHPNPWNTALALVDCIGGQEFSETRLLQLVPIELGRTTATSSETPLSTARGVQQTERWELASCVHWSILPRMPPVLAGTPIPTGRFTLPYSDICRSMCLSFT